MAVIDQGEMWAEFPDEKSRPYLVLTRQRAIERLAAVMVAPVTTRMRGLPSEVELFAEDGIRRRSVANFDNLRTIDKHHLTRRVSVLTPGRWHEVCAAMQSAIDC